MQADHLPVLNSFTAPINVAVIGASGGIGSALAHQLSQHHAINSLHCFSRSAHSISHPKTHSYPIDVSDEASIERAALALKDNLNAAPLDLVIVTCGVLHDDGGLLPEKNLRDLNMDHFERVFAINTFGPALIAKYFLPLIAKDRKSVFAALSARVGSISDNALGGWYAYRSSKAALNMLIKTTAIEMQRRYKKACIIGLHPGTVDTDLSAPFQNHVKPEKLFTPDQSARHLLKVINDVTPDQSGSVFAWDGQIIAP